ncbi:MAG: polyprenyl synthetase family protein [Polyangiales bacterium]
MKALPTGAALEVTLSALLDSVFLQGDDAEAKLARGVPQVLWDEALLRPLRDFLARPSKGFRAGLVELGYRMSGGADSGLPIELPLIIECLHAGSLIIDDIEDQSLERRGAPALHCTYGVPRALNAGNWLYFWPQVLLSRVPLRPETRLLAHERMALCLLRCHEGQALDLQVRIERLAQSDVANVARTVSQLKTGGLLGLATALGAMAADAPADRAEAIGKLGRELGVGLQMLDDVSGVLNPARRHKALEDLRLGRVTWVWACLAEELDRAAYDALLDQARVVMAGSGVRTSDALLERLRFRMGHVGVRRAREHVHAAVDALASVLGRGAWCETVLEQFGWLERRYVQA